VGGCGEDGWKGGVITMASTDGHAELMDEDAASQPRQKSNFSARQVPTQQAGKLHLQAMET
jgi:hypothetical protein